jgi:hypothetical protein
LRGEAMRKLSKEKKRNIKAVKYRWEFLRRNEQFIQDWRELQIVLKEKRADFKFESHVQWNTVMNFNGINVSMLSPQRQVLQPEERKFCEKWNISEPVDPKKSYEEYFDYELRELKRAIEEGRVDGVDWHRNLIDKVDTCSLYWKLRPIHDRPIKELDAYRDHTYHLQEPVRYWHHYLDDKVVQEGRLRVEINLNFSKARLKKEFDIMLTWWQKEYEESFCEHYFPNKVAKELDADHAYKLPHRTSVEVEAEARREFKKKKAKYRGQRRFDNYEKYLEVYDMRKARKSWSKIQETLKLYSIQTARDYYKAASKLIEKGVSL